MEHDRVPAADAFRIVVVGNSYSMTFQVERDDGYDLRTRRRITEMSRAGESQG